MWAQTLTLNLDDISGADWAARQVRVSLTANGAAQLSAGTFSALDREFKDVHIDCGRFAFDKQQIRCEAGRLRTGTNQDEAWPLELIYETRSRRLQFSFAPAAQERWAFTLANGEARLDLDQAEASRIAPLLKSELLPNAGRMSGVLRFAPARASADLNFTGIGFADSAGLHAGEKLAGRFVLEAARSAKVWNWSTVLDWNDGAVFWDPVFVASAGHRVEARGTLDEARVEVREALLDWRGLGRLTGAMVWDRAANRAVDFVIEGRALVLAALREFVPQVWAEQHHLADLRLAGAADLRVEGSASRLRRAALSLRNAQADAPQRALAIDNLNADLRYELAGTAPVSLNLAALRIRGLTLGPIEAKGEMRDGRLTAQPVLQKDGRYQEESCAAAEEAHAAEESSYEHPIVEQRKLHQRRSAARGDVFFVSDEKEKHGQRHRDADIRPPWPSRFAALNQRVQQQCESQRQDGDSAQVQPASIRRSGFAYKS